MGRRKLLILIQCIGVIAVASPLSADSWRFIMTCDSRGDAFSGINERVLSELSAEILISDVDLVIFPGDLVYGARVGPERFERQLWEWVRAMQPVYGAGVAVYVCRGNHEVGDMWDAVPGQPPDAGDNYALRWLRVFGGDLRPELKLPGNGPAGEEHMTYSVAHKNALILSLDQYAGTEHWLAHFVNEEWLAGQIEANRQPHVFAFGHEPAFQALHPDCLDDWPSRRDAFWGVLQAAGARVYLCGHDHFYDHARIDDGDGTAHNDIHQYIVGVAGAPPYSWVPVYDGENGDFTVRPIHHAERYGYLLVEVDELDVTLTWMERQTNDLFVPGVYEAKDVWSYSVPPSGAACRRRPAADLNGDCRVDSADLAILASEWLSEGTWE